MEVYIRQFDDSIYIDSTCKFAQHIKKRKYNEKHWTSVIAAHLAVTRNWDENTINEWLNQDFAVLVADTMLYHSADSYGRNATHKIV